MCRGGERWLAGRVYIRVGLELESVFRASRAGLSNRIGDLDQRCDSEGLVWLSLDGNARAWSCVADGPIQNTTDRAILFAQISSSAHTTVRYGPPKVYRNMPSYSTHAHSQPILRLTYRPNFRVLLAPHWPPAKAENPWLAS